MTTARLRPEGPADAAAVRRVLTAAFARPGVAVPDEVALVEALRDTDAWLPDLAMVAEEGDAGGATAGDDISGYGEVVGYALLTRVRVVPGAFPALALGPVAVLPGRQRRGYGSAVVWAALDAAAELGERLVVVLGDPAWYERFGFVPASRFGLTSPWSGLGAPWQALVLPPDVSGPAPVPAGEVRYPPPWSAV
nr:N-acetyltransferase [Micromonospora sp. DSM 115978]